MSDSNVSISNDYKDLAMTLDQSLLSNATFIGRASGRSMEGVGIFDLLLIDRAATVKHGDVIVAQYNGAFVCKLADLKNNRLLSASPDHKPVKLTEYDNYNVEGVVTRSIRIFREPLELRE